MTFMLGVEKAWNRYKDESSSVSIITTGEGREKKQMYNCYTPRLASSKEEADSSAFSDGSTKKRQINRQGRINGRSWNQFRPMYMDVGIIQASGSAYVEINHTKVVCAIYGPKPRQDVEFSDQGTILCDFRYAPFARRVRRERSIPQDDEKAFSQLVSQAIESSIQLKRLPKSVIEIYIIVLQADGGELGAAITCTSLALADSGIELFGLVAACAVVASSFSSSKSNSNSGSPSLLLDPTAAEESEAGGAMTLALMPSSGEVTQVRHEGRFDAVAMDAALELATDGTQVVHAMMRKRLLKSLEEPPLSSSSASPSSATARRRGSRSSSSQGEEGERGHAMDL